MSGQLSCVVIPAPQGTAPGARITVAKLTGEPGHAGRASRTVVPGQGLPCAVQLGAPGGAVLGQAALQGAGADGQAASQRGDGQVAVLEGVGEQMPDVLVPGGPRRREGGRGPAEGAPQRRGPAGQRPGPGAGGGGG